MLHIMNKRLKYAFVYATNDVFTFLYNIANMLRYLVKPSINIILYFRFCLSVCLQSLLYYSSNSILDLRIIVFFSFHFHLKIRPKKVPNSIK